MAHKKGQSSSKNGRESHGQRLGVKKFGGEVVTSGMIIGPQRGTVVHAGQNVGRGKDDTLFALVNGKVQFSRFGKTRKKVHVLPVPVEAN